MPGQGIVLAPSPLFVRRAELLLLVESNLDPGLIGLVEWMLDNASRPLKVEDVARAAGIHRRALGYRLAKARTLPPNRLLRWCRVLRAADLLSRTGASKEEVASVCGFQSVESLKKGLARCHLSLRAVRCRDGFLLALATFKRDLLRLEFEVSGALADERETKCCAPVLPNYLCR